MNNLTQEILFSSNAQPENPQIALLKQYFPNCFDKHGAFLPDKMAEIVHSDGIATQKESYSLNWLGKSYAKVLKDAPPATLLAEDTAHNSLPQNANSENLLIKGDNLEVLKHLKNAYKNQIKMIYIDPPYNTGSDGFVYQDDRKFTPEQLAELGGMDLDEAKRVLEFTAKKSNSHSAWLTFMYPRLYIARELLREDGVIFISIDDNEQAQLKILCDEVFGEENFVAELPTIMNLKGNNDEFGFAGTHEYTLVYSKNKEILILNEFSIDEESLNEWKKDKKGFYKQGANLKATGTNAPREKRPNLFFPVFIDDNNNIFVTEDDEEPINNYGKLINILPITNNQEMSWRWSKNKFMSKNDDIIVSRNNGNISLYKKQRPSLGDLPSKKPKTLFYKPQYSSGNGTAIIKDLFDDEKVFQNPKPLELLKDFIKIATSSNDLVLDFFAGSGTTAHAVMQLNAEDGGNRKFICVQLPEKTDKKSEAFKAGYETIFDITKARIEKSAHKICQDFPNASGDFGFKIYQTEPNFQIAHNEDFDPIQPDLPDSVNAMLSDEQLHTLLTTWRVYDGSMLSEKVQPLDLAGYTAYFCRGHLYLLASGFSSEHIIALIDRLDNDTDFVPERIVLFGKNMDSAMQKELAQAVKTYANKKGLNNLSVLARY
ncbi:adenine-specific DNA-methyltransferase [Moraxella cuniculi DSM 21768]|uniref:site-specific DNA-methyltransferase (adenine-specific) n=1 Tax=Moraxella cuniculi DSM 21768 TaxID=1122245 RepID=A0A1N7FL94_9GAMM|nr:site-specific DNA-methyltransferase [Moraxella cuniculi]OOS05741.1 type III restriction endonuclease subunit M [Moraxella cuniculi]SIS01037.1 adenine-specific DNA-methyltransferase [Moraxella cuniculi DSM 21768]